MKNSIKADVIVIGAGGSGLTAAVAALEAGAKKIIVLEKRNKPGGNAIFPDGLFAAGSNVQRRLGLDANVDEVFQQAMAYSHWKINAPLLRTLINKSSETILWLEKKGINFTTLISHYPNQVPNTYHAAGGPGTTGSMIVKILQEICLNSDKIKIYTSTAADKLLRDEKGRICGVVAHSREGQIKFVTKAVVICTGGFSGNEKLLKQYDPSYNKEDVPPMGIPHKGDGVRMAVEAGAALDGMITYEWEEHSKASDYLTAITRRPETVWLNKAGRRFIDESYPVLPEIANAIYRQPGMVMFSIFDEFVKKQMLEKELSPFERQFLQARFIKDIASIFPAKIEKDLKEHAAKGNVKIAASWDEISEWIGTESATVTNTIKKYNSFCSSGYDEELVKNRIFLKPLTRPPFYAIRCGVKLTVTHGGVKINELTQALDENDKPIPGLYAAGVETGATDWDTYNMRLSGHSFSFTINTGRIAGEQAARFTAEK
jgi:fumarate reductase flavoprotein subunit